VVRMCDFILGTGVEYPLFVYGEAKASLPRESVGRDVLFPTQTLHKIKYDITK